MAHLDYLTNLLNAYDHDPRCSVQFASGYRAVLGRLNASSSLTSRRYPIWRLVRANLDGPFDQCLADYEGEWAKSLLSGARLSEMAHIPPPFCAAPHARREIDGGGLGPDILASGLVGSRPENMPEIDWQLLNLDRWDSNIELAIRSLLDANDAPLDGAESLCGALESVRDLFRLMRHFRPRRTKALKDFDVLIDDRIRPQDGGYCELCWRSSVRSNRLQELAVQQRHEVGEIVRSAGYQLSDLEQEARLAQAWMPESSLRLSSPSCSLISKAEAAELRLVFERFRSERIFAGNLSSRYCHVHKPGSQKYHADLRYKAAFHHHLSVLSRSRRSEFAFNFLPPSAADTQELRKVAYDQVHSGLHVVTTGRAPSLGLREKVWLMREEGISQSEMARRLGISRQAISKAKKSLITLMNAHIAGREIDPRTGETHVPEPIRDAIKDAAAKGRSITAIAKEVGLSKGTVDGLVRLIREL